MGVTAALFALGVFWIVIAKLRRPRPSLPPGPKGWPIVGNALDLPTIRPWEKYHEWCDTYKSDIVYLDIPLQPTLIIGSFATAIELFEKRSHLYSDRIQSVMVALMTWDFSLGFMPYTPRWRAHRRMFHQEFHQGAVQKHRPVQLQLTRVFLSRILKSPEHTRKHLRHFVTSVIFYVTYGKKIATMDDESVVAARLSVEGLSTAIVPGAFWIEFLPFLRYLPSWIPFMSSKRTAEEYLTHVINMRDKPYFEVKDSLARGNAPVSWAATLIEQNRAQYGGSEEEATFDEIARNVTGAAYAAGADTTTSACESFLLAMALFPEVQTKAQAELDCVVGPDRLPEYDDLEHMPYVRAVVMETMRWLPVVPFGIPHAVTADDVYNGYHMAKGTLVIPNIWAMLRNSEDYPDPDTFKPERFLDKDGSIDRTVRNPDTIAFGFGRRICAGRAFSNNTLSIFIASILHVFKISAGVDAAGNPRALSTEMIGGMIAMPLDVPCGLTPRSEAVMRLIADSAVELEG